MVQQASGFVQSCVHRFGSEGDFSCSWDNGGFFFASFFAGLSLAGSGFLEGVSGELLVLHNLRSYVISRGDGGR